MSCVMISGIIWREATLTSLLQAAWEHFSTFCANVLCDDVWHHLVGGHSHLLLAGGLGTFQYMAPEVMANQRYSVKADVYSFGMVLWECTARQVCSHSPCLAELKADVYSFGMVLWEGTARQVRSRSSPLAELSCPWTAVCPTTMLRLTRNGRVPNVLLRMTCRHTVG